eukprot:TRINITY_DN971_c0_g1::TRINITY_DN971_c0_g1_i1::g.16136::m.16136 TRINITY_DN971_c0_g1::TRINITY_DN971_c0_g1_i1::g.16136  ORF type:complete len:546 (+),score=71.50,sp/Q9HGN5/YO45_SCHPO/46.51/3e-09,Ank_4/PF13637.1/1.2e+04,Ank_4/PF13637.1/19,Ank_4/PF13637.1/3.4e+02,Ank_4/PF13637.1/0.0011,Ank_4/PF13637.1/3.4e+03,Ank_4/PF13637.1/1.2e+02,Ank_4/PF13637.1/0.051,Ank_4/PF13637.1/3.1,Ank_4/PF13637.1/2.8e+03,FYVE/PF01363.16/3.5e-14,Ank_2/PF12796.2/1.5e+02,Ank_2/PF12796.2/0.15,Ank_2/PF12796.2/2.1,Ank_2/PF12796.2/
MTSKTPGRFSTPKRPSSFLEGLKERSNSQPHRRISVTGVWSLDEDHPACEACGALFSFLNRRHHCRWCGRVLCGNCCSTVVPDVEEARRYGLVGQLCCATCRHRAASFDPEPLCDRWDHLMHIYTLGLNGHLQTHCAIACGGSLLEITAALSASNDCPYLENNRGEIPLHVAMRCADMTVEKIDRILEFFPEGAKSRNKVGNLPLHTGARTGCHVHVMERILAAYPAAVSTSGQWGNLPLHFAAMSLCPQPAVVHLLATIFPDAATRTNDKGDLPLHCCATRTSTGPLVTAMLRLNPAAVSAVNLEGNIPLFSLVSAGSPPAAIYPLLDASRDLLHTVRLDGNSLVHCAAATLQQHTHVDLAVFQAILATCTSTLLHTNRNGETALHCAALSRVGHKLAPAFLTALANAEPRAMTVKNKHGDTPVHAAVRKGTSPEVVETLLRARPLAAFEPDNEGELLLHIAYRRVAVEEAILNSVLYRNFKAMLVKDKDGRVPNEIKAVKKVAVGARWRVVRVILAAHFKNRAGAFDILPLALIRKIIAYVDS